MGCPVGFSKGPVSNFWAVEGLSHEGADVCYDPSCFSANCYWFCQGQYINIEGNMGLCSTEGVEG